MTCVAIIPARGGSRRIPRKNIKIFHGKPIIAYSIETAKASGLFDRIIVSTDDDEIASVAIEYGAEIHRRSEEMARDEVGTQAVAASVLNDLYPQCDACVIYPTAPMLQPQDLRQAYRELLTSRGRDFVFAVGAHPLRDAGMFYWGRCHSFVFEEDLISIRSTMFPIPEERVCDINTEEDFLKAEKMYAQLHGIKHD